MKKPHKIKHVARATHRAIQSAVVDHVALIGVRAQRRHERFTAAQLANSSFICEVIR